MPSHAKAILFVYSLTLAFSFCQLLLQITKWCLYMEYHERVFATEPFLLQYTVPVAFCRGSPWDANFRVALQKCVTTAPLYRKLAST